VNSPVTRLRLCSTLKHHRRQSDPGSENKQIVPTSNQLALQRMQLLPKVDRYHAGGRAGHVLVVPARTFVLCNQFLRLSYFLPSLTLLLSALSGMVLDRTSRLLDGSRPGQTGSAQDPNRCVTLDFRLDHVHLKLVSFS